MRVSTKATLSTYNYGTHSTRRKINVLRDRVSIISNTGHGLAIFERLLEKLVEKGAKPGAELHITVSTKAR